MLRRTFLQAAAPAVWAQGLAKDLARALEAMPLGDTHEHFWPEAERNSKPLDVFTLIGHYVIDDAISAGLGGEDLTLVRNPDAPLRRRWQAFEPYWREIRFGGYAEALRIAARDLYGVEEIHAGNVERFNAALAEKNRPGWYQTVLRERARIEFCVLDSYWITWPDPPDPDYYRQAWRFDRYFQLRSRQDLADIEKFSGVSVTDLRSLKSAMEKQLTKRLARGLCAVKLATAYHRRLRFEAVPEAEAERSFAALARLPLGDVPARGSFQPLEDHLLHHLAGLLEASGKPIQVHTGMQAGARVQLDDTDPEHLTNLFRRFPRLRFDLFHIGLPFHHKAMALAKSYPNVWVDFCWTWMISPSLGRATLSQMLEAVPVNKILAFGGDSNFPEIAYAHAQMARRAVAVVLAEKVAERWCSEAEALEIARSLLLRNAERLFPGPGVSRR
jgi:predicted TIM-barrel fold metal-dependent hydrolase